MMKPPVIFKYILGIAAVAAGLILFSHVLYGYSSGITEHLLYVWPAVLVGLLLLNVWVAKFYQKQVHLSQALQASEECFRNMAENAKDIIARFELAPQFYCAYINSAVKTVSGYSPEEFYSDPELASKIVHPEDKALWGLLIKGELELGKPHSLRWICKDTSIIWVEQRMVRVCDDAGKLTAFEAMFRDITETKQAAEKALLFSKEQYRSLFEETKDVVFISTPEGKFLDINPAGIALFGYASKEELLLANIAQDIYADPEQREVYKSTLAKNKFVKDFELILRKKDGQKVIVLETTTAVTDGHGNILAYRGIMRDISEKQRVEVELSQIQKIETLGLLTSGIVHDFNNILFAISGYVELMQSSVSPEHQCYGYLKSLEQSVNQGTEFTTKLLAFAHDEKDEMQTLNLNDLVKETLAIIRTTFSSKIKIETYFSDALPLVNGVKSQLQQVVMNLYLNACDAMPQGGKLTLSTVSKEVTSEAMPANSEAKPGRYVTLAVADTGIGMNPETSGKMFESFFTTKEKGKGTGLGLSTVNWIVKGHHGFLRVESELSKGSTFRVFLPAL
jgi:PAS domain S-box-containing protein